MDDAIFPPGQRALIHTHELMTMSASEAKAKWQGLAEASGLDGLLFTRVTLLLLGHAGLDSGPDGLITALDHIKRADYLDDLQREKGLKFVEDTVVPSYIPSDDSHFSFFSLPFSYSHESLLIHVYCASELTLDQLMQSPYAIQLDLDDEMRPFARQKFNDYWSLIAKGPWANDIVRDHVYEKHSVYRHPLPTFRAFGNKEQFKPGPYSRSDIQEWLDSRALLNLMNRAIQDSNNRAIPQDELLNMFGSLSLETDGDNGDNGGSMDTS